MCALTFFFVLPTFSLKGLCDQCSRVKLVSSLPLYQLVVTEKSFHFRSQEKKFFVSNQRFLKCFLAHVKGFKRVRGNLKYFFLRFRFQVH